jgi:hypothetical protein
MSNMMRSIVCVGSIICTPGWAQEVRVTGCPTAGVEAGCIVLKGQDGTLFNISSADPKPDLTRRLVITVIGTKSGGPSACMQGQTLIDVHWRYTRQRCPE